jgi:hypothetical protein
MKVFLMRQLWCSWEKFLVRDLPARGALVSEKEVFGKRRNGIGAASVPLTHREGGEVTVVGEAVVVGEFFSTGCCGGRVGLNAMDWELHATPRTSPIFAFISRYCRKANAFSAIRASNLAAVADEFFSLN